MTALRDSGMSTLYSDGHSHNNVQANTHWSSNCTNASTREMASKRISQVREESRSRWEPSGIIQSWTGMSKHQVCQYNKSVGFMAAVGIVRVMSLTRSQIVRLRETVSVKEDAEFPSKVRNISRPSSERASRRLVSCWVALRHGCPLKQFRFVSLLVKGYERTFGRVCSGSSSSGLTSRADSVMRPPPVDRELDRDGFREACRSSPSSPIILDALSPF